MPKKLKFSADYQEPIVGDASQRAAIYMRRASGDKSRAMDEAAAHGDREALEVINPAKEA